MKLKYLLILPLLTLMSTSCTEWLNVQPSDRISEEQNFTSLPGFKQALNGLYIELNSSELYGRNLSYELVEILAQRYAISADNKAAYELMNLNYTGTSAQGKLESIWGKAYNLIANTNLIIKNCEKHRDVLPDEYYHLIKGEAYALRAYLHFDLFRLFGPCYDPEQSTTALPYYTEQTLDVNPKETSKDFMAKVEADLLVAEAELENDPIVKYGVQGNYKDVFLQFRNLRLNVYAVQGLLTRFYYYAKNDEKALEYANKVIDAQARCFPWVQPIALTRANVDRVFSTEIMFALQNLQRESIFTSNFDGNNLKLNQLLAPKEDVVTQIFEGSKAAGDYRFMSSFKSAAEVGGSRYTVFNKYHGTDSLYNQMIPMIRTSEAFLIAAEIGTDSNERLKSFNALRNNRGLASTTKVTDLNRGTNLTKLIEKEWIKETFGEGQLFFWYKRNKYTKMRSAFDTYNDSPFQVSSSTKYVMPLPDGEIKFD